MYKIKKLLIIKIFCISIMNKFIKVLKFSKTNTIKIFLKTPDITSDCKLKMKILGTPFLKFLFHANKKHSELFKSDDVIEHQISTYSELFDVVCGDEEKSTFTYCFKSDGRLYLCKVKTKENDMNCKHVFLCRKMGGICAAGIIVFIKDIKEIYIDNLSGTYRTYIENIELLKNSLILSFSDISNNKIKAIDIKKEKNKKTYCNIFKESVNFKTICNGTKL